MMAICAADYYYDLSFLYGITVFLGTIASKINGTPKNAYFFHFEATFYFNHNELTGS